jgi:hypothetical protein
VLLKKVENRGSPRQRSEWQAEDGPDGNVNQAISMQIMHISPGDTMRCMVFEWLFLR